MTRFEELQQIWQSQPQEAAALDIRGATSALRRFGRRQNIINGLKLAGIIWQAGFTFWKMGLSPLLLVAEALIMAAMANLLLADWSTQLGIARLDFSTPSASFIESALQRLRDPNAGYRRRFWLNVVMMGIGMNLVAVVQSRNVTWQHRLQMHAWLIAILIVAFTWGFKVHGKRLEMEYRPIRKQLLAMQQAIEEQRQ
jgi:hypothetical protein